MTNEDFGLVMVATAVMLADSIRKGEHEEVARWKDLIKRLVDARQKGKL